MSEDERASPDEEGPIAVVLDVLPHGRAEDDRPQYQKQPLVYAMGVEDFVLYECVVDDGLDAAIGDRVDLGAAPAVETLNATEFDDLPSGAAAELEYAVEDLVAAEEGRFVDFYNEAQPITLRLHQLNLLPGIGEKLRDGILDERKRRPFDSFADLEARVDGLHDAEGVIVDRIVEEFTETDLKYRTFVGRDASE